MAGLILMTIYVSAILHRTVSSRIALSQFEKAEAAALPKELSTPAPSGAGQGVDLSLWAANRIQAYKDSLLSKGDPPLAVLQIASLRIRVPVFDGTDDLTLNRGVGRITGTARPGETGNIGIAGHRDGFFRGLKDVAIGDEVELSTTGATVTYVVDQIEIVSPDEVGVLRARSVPSLTLVTCYPFYFVGNAPQRFVVHSSMTSDHSGPKVAQVNTREDVR